MLLQQAALQASPVQHAAQGGHRVSWSSRGSTPPDRLCTQVKAICQAGCLEGFNMLWLAQLVHLELLLGHSGRQDMSWL